MTPKTKGSHDPVRLSFLHSKMEPRLLNHLDTQFLFPSPVRNPHPLQFRPPAGLPPFTNPFHSILCSDNPQTKIHLRNKLHLRGRQYLAPRNRGTKNHHPSPASSTQQVDVQRHPPRPPRPPLGPQEAGLIHLLRTNSRLPKDHTHITMGPSTISNKDTIQLLGITIDQKMSFRQQSVLGISKSQNLLPFMQCMAFSRGVCIKTHDQIVTTLLIPTLIWGSEMWWTSIPHILDYLKLTYHRFTNLIPSLSEIPRTTKSSLHRRYPSVRSTPGPKGQELRHSAPPNHQRPTQQNSPLQGPTTEKG